MEPFIPKIIAIACVYQTEDYKKLGIGYKNELLFHIKEDMKFFKEKTTNNIVVYGNNTLKSFPKKHPLPNRINFVITHDIKNIPQETIQYCNRILYYNGENIDIILGGRESTTDLYVSNSISTALKEAYLLGYSKEKDIYICGGESIYNQTIDYCNEAYLNFVNYYNGSKEVDSYFPNILSEDVENWSNSEEDTDPDKVKDRNKNIYDKDGNKIHFSYRHFINKSPKFISNLFFKEEK